MQSARPRFVLPRERSCDVEPIHVPGAIQPHGLLLLFDAASETLAHWAGDVDLFLGVMPEVGNPAGKLLGLRLRNLVGQRLLIAGEEAIYVGLINPPGRAPLSASVSRTGSFISVELEPAGDESSPAAILERVRSVSDRMIAISSLLGAYDVAVAHIRAITGYDHVMVYRFLPDGSGSVVAEARAPDVTALLDHRFPASDIPAQARDLYRRNLIRVIPDVSYEPAPLRPASAIQIDMSHGVLRSVSPIHLQYLENMGVGASMSVSILVKGELWGLIACHHRVARGIMAESRLLCRHVGTALSAFILSFGHAENARRSAECAVALENTLKSLSGATDPERTLRSSANQLATLVGSGGFALLAGGELVAGAGALPEAGLLSELALQVEAELADHESFATDRLGERLNDAPMVLAEASGVLAVRVEASRPLLALWVRPEQVEEISWAGDRRVKDAAIDPLRTLTPRKSFATWRETVRGHSRPWTRHEIDVVEQFQARAEFIMQRHRLKQLNQELAEANAALSELVTTDALTGLPNRRLFDERLAGAWQRALREQSSIAIVTIDVDQFKKYNDRFGHPAGDECLRQVAAAIGAGHREVDVGARLGGEEFGLLLPDTDADAAAVVAERVRLAVEQLGLAHPMNSGGVVTISLGIAAGTPAQWEDTTGLIRAADEALYIAKDMGRNRTCTANPKRST